MADIARSKKPRWHLPAAPRLRTTQALSFLCTVDHGHCRCPDSRHLTDTAHIGQSLTIETRPAWFLLPPNKDRFCPDVGWQNDFL